MPNYYEYIKTHYGKLSPEKKLEFFHHEMLNHIQTLYDLMELLQNVNSSTVKKFQNLELCIKNILPDNVDKIQEVLDRELADNAITAHEKLEVLHYSITIPPIFITVCSEIILEIITNKNTTEFPAEYEQWAKNLDGTCQKIEDLANALMDKPKGSSAD
jgi:hypothetical protein